MDDSDSDDHHHHFFRPAPSALFSLSPFTAPSPAPRRLSSQFIEPSRPVPASRKKLAWLSLQGRIVNAEEATAARTIGGGLGKEEVVALEIFSPMQRVLVVAVVAVAAAQSRKSKEIRQLKLDIAMRDQVLSIMQQKLENMCEQVNYFQDQPLGGVHMLITKSEKMRYSEASDSEESSVTGFNCCGGRRGSRSSISSMGNPATKWNEMAHSEHPCEFNDQQEERRLSGMSDWASSVTSSSDFQLISLEQDLHNLRIECQEKDEMIKELSLCLKSVEVAGSKRIAGLEAIIRRNNTRITKLQKDMVILKHKLTRARRPSARISNSPKAPFMTENVLYDLDSTTGPSSDSDYSHENKPPIARKSSNHNKNKPFVSRREYTTTETKSSIASEKPTDYQSSSRSACPLKEISLNERPASSQRLKQPRFAQDLNKVGRRAPTEFQSGSKSRLLKRWV